MHSQCRWRRRRSGDEMSWISWDESFKKKFVLVCIISVSKVPKERKWRSVSVFEWIFAFTPCLVSRILQDVLHYIFHMLALFLHMKYDSWWPLQEQLCSTWWFVSCLSLLLLNFFFSNLITKESWWKTLFKVYMICSVSCFPTFIIVLSLCIYVYAW